MKPTTSIQEARRNKLRRQLTELESAIESLKLKKDTDDQARSEYYRLRVLWVRKKALIDAN